MAEQEMKQLVWKPLILPNVLEPDYDLVVNLKLGREFENNWFVDEILGDELVPKVIVSVIYLFSFSKFVNYSYILPFRFVTRFLIGLEFTFILSNPAINTMDWSIVISKSEIERSRSLLR